MKKNLLKLLFVLLVFSPTFHAFAQNPINPYKAPLYWDVYENNFMKEKSGVSNNYISEDELLANVNWVDTNLKSLGYNMICIDGWGDADYNQYGYRTKHSNAWTHDYAWWSAELQKRGMTLGIYNNPLWINTNAANAGLKVKGTNILLSSLINNNENSLWFKWLQVNRPGAEEYVKGYVQYYADMGVKFLRVDFLSWFESGYDRNVGTVGPDRRNSYINGLSYYETALKWMREACDANGMFLSLVMPNLYTDAAIEQKYGHMVRINEDCAEGGWYRFSDSSRGVHNTGWSQFANPFDGYVYWSKIAGRGKMILDGDFIRLNTYANDEERKCVVSLHLMAGGPVSIADQYNTIGSSLWVYQNEDLLGLNQDGFVGTPLSNDPTNALNQVWKGQLKNGDWIVGFFNREGSAQTRSINFQNDLGISGNVFVRDLWGHSDLGVVASSLSKSIPSHGCMIFRISSNSNKVISPTLSLKGGSYSGARSVSLSTTTQSASIYFTTDGSTPTASSTLYTNPIQVTATATVRAIAIKSGMADSYVSKEKYFINEAPAQSAMYVGASFNSWTLSNAPMKNTGGNNWTTDPITIPAGDQVMKFANSPNWTGDDWGNASGLNGTAQKTTGGGSFIAFNAPESGKYIINFNDYTLSYSIQKTLNSSQSQMYVAGTFSNWTLGTNKMSLVQNNLWQSSPINITAGSHQLKFANTSDWTGDDWGNASGLIGEAKLTTGGAPNITINAPVSKPYIFTFNDLTLAYSISGISTGVEAAGSSKISLYPNPVSDRLNINLGEESEAKISIFDATGKMVSKSHIIGSRSSIDIQSHKISGICLVKVTTATQTKIFKIEVSR